jgi:hypothetical protein
MPFSNLHSFNVPFSNLHSVNVPFQGDLTVTVYSMAQFLTNQKFYSQKSDYYSNRDVFSPNSITVLVEITKNMHWFYHSFILSI